jgi:hypothetical protein
LLREAERPRSSATPIYFKALRELRSEASIEHGKAIAGQADFAAAARIWLEIQIAFAALYLAWFLPRRTGWGLAICQFITPRLNETVWHGPIPTAGFGGR